jgi:hypothetical protein
MPRSTFVFALVSSAVLTHAAGAQELPRPRPSQHGTVSQEVALTTITLAYDRPVARGRELYGGIIDWDVVATPGANRATWIEFSTPVTFHGARVDAGRYGLWHVSHEAEPWELILVREWDTHHSYFPMESEVARVRVTPERGAHMETMAFYFPVVADYETVLRLHWGSTILPMRIEVPR